MVLSKSLLASMADEVVVSGSWELLRQQFTDTFTWNLCC